MKLGKEEMPSARANKPIVVLGARFRQDVVDRLSAQYEVITTDEAAISPETLSPRARSARAMVTRGAIPTSSALMDALPALGLIACYGAGYEGVDLAAAAARNIAVTYSPGATAASVADMAMGLLLATDRRIVAADRFVRTGDWHTHPAPQIAVAPGLTGKRIGIYGLGLIGSKIAARAAAFEMTVGYTGRAPHEGVSLPYFATPADLASWADVLVVAARLTPQNRGIIDKDVLRALGRTGQIVNIARGALVDEQAMIEALEAGTLGGAGLDVFDREPGVPERLLNLPNVVLTPHIGGSTESSQTIGQNMVLANLDAFFTGQALPNRIVA